MTTVYWIMGGTCVGKKTFIDRALAGDVRCLGALPANTAKVWFDCGGMSLEKFLAAIADCDAALVRWQWGREKRLNSLCESNGSGHRHIIVLLECEVKEQLRRVVEREGCCKWDSSNLTGESVSSRKLAYCIARRWGLQMLRIDTTGDYRKVA